MSITPKHDDPFKNLSAPIEAIENHTKWVLKHCEEISESYPRVAEKIGYTIADSLLVTSFLGRKYLPKKGQVLISTMALVTPWASSLCGKVIAKFKKLRNEFELRNKIKNQNTDTKKKIYPSIKEMIKDYESSSKRFDNKIYSMGKTLTICSSSEEMVKKNEIEKLKCLLKDFFQTYYRLTLLEKTRFYFDNFKEKIKNLEEFAVWYSTEINVNKLACYKQAYDKIHSKMLSMSENDNQREIIENAFYLLSSETPVLAHFDMRPTDILFEEINRKLSAEEQDEKFKPRYPAFYYSGLGFQEIFKVCKKHFKSVKENDYIFGLSGIILLCIASLFANYYFWNKYLSLPFALSSLLILALFILWIDVHKKAFFDNPVKKIIKYKSAFLFEDIELLVKKYLDEECIITNDKMEKEDSVK